MSEHRYSYRIDPYFIPESVAGCAKRVFFYHQILNKNRLSLAHCALNRSFTVSRDLKFTGYVAHYKIVTWNIFGLILKNKIAATGVSLSVMKSAYISLIIKRPARDACLYVGGYLAPPAPLLLGAPRFLFLITLWLLGGFFSNLAGLCRRPG